MHSESQRHWVPAFAGMTLCLTLIAWIFSNIPAPHFDSNIFGTFASTGVRNAFGSGVMTVIPLP